MAGRPGGVLRLVVGGRQRRRRIPGHDRRRGQGGRRHREGRQEPNGKSASYKGHDYYAIEGGAAGVVDGWVVLGSESGFKAAVDTAEGGAPLEDDDTYAKTLADAPDRAARLRLLQHAGLREAAARVRRGRRAGPDSQASSRTRCSRPSTPTSTACAWRRRCRSRSARPSRSSARAAVARATCPADSWLAIAQPDLGKTISYFVDSFGAVAGGRGMLEQQLKAATGLDLTGT